MEHVCENQNPCSCGRKWDYKRTYSTGDVYFTSADVVAKYHALYGRPEIPFVKCDNGKDNA